jgi:hypothetical protein
MTTLVQQELRLTLPEMREACRALKAAADSGLGIRAREASAVHGAQEAGAPGSSQGRAGRVWLCGGGGLGPV